MSEFKKQTQSEFYAEEIRKYTWVGQVASIAASIAAGVVAIVASISFAYLVMN